KPVRNIRIKRIDLKSGIFPTFRSYCETGIRKRYQLSDLDVPSASCTVVVLTSVIYLSLVVIFGLIGTSYWKYSSTSFMVLSLFNSSASGYWVKALMKSEFSLIGELPCGL